MPQINQELLRLGLAALRSGRYKKGIGALHRVVGSEPGPDDEHCCLGVLSIVAAENGCPVERVIVYSSFHRRERFGDQENEYLSFKVMQWYGFDDSDPKLIASDGQRVTASGWNDGGSPVTGVVEDDFGEIADAFERTYLTV